MIKILTPKPIQKEEQEEPVRTKEEILSSLPLKFQKQLNILIPFLKKYGVTQIYLFGSLYEGTYNDDSDIDIAISGLNPSLYYKIYGIIMYKLKIDCDIINLDEKNNGLVEYLKEQKRWIKIG